MKHILSFLILIFSLSLCAQSKEHVGEYRSKHVGENHLMENNLTLNQNGTFLFIIMIKFQMGFLQNAISTEKEPGYLKTNLYFLVQTKTM